MKLNKAEQKWLAAAAALSRRARPLSRPNPAVGAILVKDGHVAGRGWTQPAGRPHAEAMALEQAGPDAEGATLYVTLEPCAHESTRGPSCADLVIKAGVSRVIVGIEDPDLRTAGLGLQRIQAAGIETFLAHDSACHASLAGYLSARQKGRPYVTLKLALTADGYVARKDGSSKWITGEAARAHAHMERSLSDAILVGGGTFRTDDPRLDVRLPDLDQRSPRRFIMTRSEAPDGWTKLAVPQDIAAMDGMQYLMVEGGAAAAAAFLDADLVDRLLLYRAPVTFGEGIPAFREPASDGVPDGWKLTERRTLGSDTMEVYLRG